MVSATRCVSVVLAGSYDMGDEHTLDAILTKAGIALAHERALILSGLMRPPHVGAARRIHVAPQHRE